MSGFEFINEWSDSNGWPPLVYFKNAQSGLQHYHFVCDDVQKSFVLGVPIQLENNKGTAHVLEHWLLSGSQSYPVDGLFFQLPARSLKLNANAFTYSHVSGFHATTQLQADFENLLTVYADAVFRPLLEDEVFAREAIAVEAGRSVKGGVVYNEMRGILSGGVNQIVMAVQSALWSSGSHQFNAGGYPEDIASLSADETRSFWRRYYRPGNTLLITYGNLDLPRVHCVLETLLGQLDSSFCAATPVTGRSQLRSENTFEIATNKPDVNGVIVFAWNLSENLKGEPAANADRLRKPLLAKILLKSLAHSRHKTASNRFVASLCRLEQEMDQTTLLLAIKPDQKNFDACAMKQCLLRQIDGAFSPNIVQQTQQEFVRSQTVFGNERLPPGVDLSKRLLGMLLRMGDLTELVELRVDDVVNKCGEPEALTRFIDSLFDSKTPHIEATLVLAELDTSIADNAPGLCANAKISKPEYRQASFNERKTIPALSIDEIPRHPWLPEYSVALAESITTVSYRSGGSDGQARMVELTSVEDVKYAKLLQQILNIRLPGKNEKIEFEFRACPKKENSVLVGVFPDAKEDIGAMLHRQVQKLTHGDIKRTLAQIKTAIDSLQLSQAHEFAMRFASHDELYDISAAFGIDDAYLVSMKPRLDKIVAMFDTAKVFHRQDALYCAKYGGKQKIRFEDAEAEKEQAFDAGKSRASSTKKTTQTVFTIKGELNYCARSLALPVFNDADSTAAVYLLAAQLELDYLQPLIRAQGGAYGAGVRIRHDLGTMCLFSFRDPHFEQTFEIFDYALKQCLSASRKRGTWPDYQRAALGAMQRFGHADALHSKHFHELVFGYEPHARTAAWRAILNMNIASFKTRIKKIYGTVRQDDAVVGSIGECRARDFGFSVQVQ